MIKLLFVTLLPFYFFPAYWQRPQKNLEPINLQTQYSEQSDSKDNTEEYGVHFSCGASWNATSFSISGQSTGSNDLPDTLVWSVLASSPSWIYVGGTDPDGSSVLVFTGQTTPYTFSYTFQPGDEGNYTRYVLVVSKTDNETFCQTPTKSISVLP